MPGDISLDLDNGYQRFATGPRIQAIDSLDNSASEKLHIRSFNIRGAVSIRHRKKAVEVDLKRLGLS